MSSTPVAFIGKDKDFIGSLNLVSDKVEQRGLIKTGVG